MKRWGRSRCLAYCRSGPPSSFLHTTGLASTVDDSEGRSRLAVLDHPGGGDDPFLLRLDQIDIARWREKTPRGAVPLFAASLSYGLISRSKAGHSVMSYYPVDLDSPGLGWKTVMELIILCPSKSFLSARAHPISLHLGIESSAT